MLECKRKYLGQAVRKKCRRCDPKPTLFRGGVRHPEQGEVKFVARLSDGSLPNSHETTQPMASALEDTPEPSDGNLPSRQEMMQAMVPALENARDEP